MLNLGLGYQENKHDKGPVSSLRKPGHLEMPLFIYTNGISGLKFCQVKRFEVPMAASQCQRVGHDALVKSEADRKIQTVTALHPAIPERKQQPQTKESRGAKTSSPT